MIVPLNSPLDGIAADRFLSVARFLSRTTVLTDADYRKYLDQEIAWCRSHASLNNSQLAFEASVRVLLDLKRLGWQIREEGYGIELVADKIQSTHLRPDEIVAEKTRTRELFHPMVEAQYRDSYIQAFIQRMETSSTISKKKSIALLIAEGQEI